MQYTTDNARNPQDHTPTMIPTTIRASANTDGPGATTPEPSTPCKEHE